MSARIADVVVDLADHGPWLFDPTSAAVNDLVEQMSGSLIVIVASPTYKATCTGLLKSFLDRFPPQALGGVTAVPLMLGASTAHSLAAEHADPASYDAWLATAAPLLPALPSPHSHLDPQVVSA